MNIRKCSAVCLAALLFAVSGCSAAGGGKAQSVSTRSAVSIAAASKVENTVPVTSYGQATTYQARVFNGEAYFSAKDVGSLLHTRVVYDKTKNTVEMGDAQRVDVMTYLPDLSGYPNLDEEIGFPPASVMTDGGIVDFTFDTNGVTSFADTMKEIDGKLKADGFAPATAQQFEDLAAGYSEFRQNGAKNTYLKSRNAGQNISPYAIQIIDGGRAKDNLKTVIVRMAG